MNYIKKLESENQNLVNKVEEIQNTLNDLIRYYTLPKFQGKENDYAHVSTDVLFRLNELQKTINKI